ncbi:MAG TPA: GNAT family N-acetyltransferase [Acidimicrobiia bacterium]|jgi:RimJ/RimL family protein N-acetyltransferase|nr:GNAT family N-acetyltransferase [Acidimicrobiia bacterium]
MNDKRFTSERLEIRPWRIDEAERLLEIRRIPEIARWLSDPEPWADVEQAREMIREWASIEPGAPPLGTWAIVPSVSGVPVGTISLKRLPSSREIEIGWYLHPDAHGQGYAAEAATAVLRHAADAGIERVWAIMWPDNLASAKVARRAGMTDLGVRPDPWYGSKTDPDSRMFRIDLTDRI